MLRETRVLQEPLSLPPSSHVGLLRPEESRPPAAETMGTASRSWGHV